MREPRDRGEGIRLPADVPVFVNRRAELRGLDRLASFGQAVTVAVITGPAGVGKTALAVHWAHRVRDRFPDGELYADLRGFDEGARADAGAVLEGFLRDLGVSPQGIPADTDERAALFRSRAAGQRILIVLDNAADADQVRPLLPGDGGPFAVVTSRNRLDGLEARDGVQRIGLDIFAESEAAARLGRITRTGGRRDAADDLAESYRELPSEAARMFRVLGLHGGPDISLHAAAAAAGIPARDARRALDILIGAFLLEAPRSGRYQLHDLLRAYALDQARAIDSETERREALDRILRWYTNMAVNACEILDAGGFLPVRLLKLPVSIPFHWIALRPPLTGSVPSGRTWWPAQRLRWRRGCRAVPGSWLWR